MISLSKYNFRTRLIFGFSIIIVFNIISIGVSLTKIKDTQNDLTVMYRHPLVVSISLREINSNIYAIHRNMKDVALSKTNLERKIYLRGVSKQDSVIKAHFILLLNRYLGDLNDVKNAQKLYLAWAPIRNEVITLNKKEAFDKASEITKTKGNDYVDLMLAKNQVMIDFANNKANQLFADNLKKQKEATQLLLFLLTTLTVISILIALIISKSIAKPITILVSKLRKDINLPMVDSRNSPHLTEQEMLELTVNRLEVSYNNIKDFNTKLNLKVAEKTKALREVNQFFQKSVASTPLAFIYFDNKFIIQMWNLAAETIFGYTAKEAIGKNIVDLIVPKNIKEDIHKVIEAVLDETGGHTKQNENITKKGNRIMCRWHNVDIKDENNNVIGISSIVEDITKRIKIAQDLESSNQSLQDMVYIASHDLQVPLVSMEGYSAELLNNYKDTLDENGIYCLTRLQVNSKRMHKLVLSLLDISRLSTHVNPYKKFDANTMIDAIERDLTLFIEAAGTKITCGKLPNIYADKQRVESVFRNLIQNAINYEGKHIEIGFKEGAFFVKDDGIGIPPGQLSRIFEPGERLKMNKAEGVGMGLTFCKKTITLHNGTIWAASEGKNKGSIFYIKFNQKNINK